MLNVAVEFCICGVQSVAFRSCAVVVPVGVDGMFDEPPLPLPCVVFPLDGEPLVARPPLDDRPPLTDEMSVGGETVLSGTAPLVGWVPFPDLAPLPGLRPRVDGASPAKGRALLFWLRWAHRRD